MSDTIWSNEPPTEEGFYLLLVGVEEYQAVGQVYADADGDLRLSSKMFDECWCLSDPRLVAEEVRYMRVPSPEEIVAMRKCERGLHSADDWFSDRKPDVEAADVAEEIEEALAALRAAQGGK